MKTASNNRELAHLWANQSYPSAVGSNFLFDGPTLYSYGEHFPVAKLVSIGGEVVALHNPAKRSITTTRHQSLARAAVSHLKNYHLAQGLWDAVHDAETLAAAVAEHARAESQAQVDLQAAKAAARARAKARAKAEVLAHVVKYGTNNQRVALGLNPICKKYYIQRKGGGYLETVDEFETRKEALAMLQEYRMADIAGVHYLSTRPCKAWGERGGE